MSIKLCIKCERPIESGEAYQYIGETDRFYHAETCMRRIGSFPLLGSLSVSESDRDLLLSALESFLGDIEILWEDIGEDPEDQKIQAEAIESRLIALFQKGEA